MSDNLDLISLKFCSKILKKILCLSIILTLYSLKYFNKSWKLFIFSIFWIFSFDSLFLFFNSLVAWFTNSLTGGNIKVISAFSSGVKNLNTSNFSK